MGEPQKLGSTRVPP